MTIPMRPLFVKQLDGSRYAGLNCTAASAAMALDRHTLGVHRTTGAHIRALTGDTSGGLNLHQTANVLQSAYGISLEVRTPMSFGDLEAALHVGRGAMLQGAAAATKGTIYSASETFSGNHCWFVNDGRGWVKDSAGHWHATEFRVYDPLADGRRAGIASSPMWIPRSIVAKFAALLNTSGDNLLGTGWAYAALTRDTEPHAHYHYGGTHTTPFPDRTRADRASVTVRATPSSTAAIVSHLASGDLFIAYQHVPGWLGDHYGRRWVQTTQMRRVGGST